MEFILGCASFRQLKQFINPLLSQNRHKERKIELLVLPNKYIKNLKMKRVEGRAIYQV